MTFAAFLVLIIFFSVLLIISIYQVKPVEAILFVIGLIFLTASAYIHYTGL